MDEIFQRLIKTNFSELAGLRVNASIPVSEGLVNELVEAELRGSRSITYCRVSIERQNRLDVQLKTTLWPWPLNLKLKLFGSVDLSRSPTIRAFMENHVLLGRLGALLKALPPGVNIYGDQISIDISSFIKDPEPKQLLDLIDGMDIKTDQGRLILEIRIEK